MVSHLRYYLLIGLTCFFLQNCCSSKQLPKRILVEHEATCYSYNSAMGKGHGIKLVIALNKSTLNKQQLIIDSLFIHNKSVVYIQTVKTEYVELEFNNYYQQAETSLNTDGSIQMENKKTDEINASNLVPSYILVHNKNKKYRIDITHFSSPKP